MTSRETETHCVGSHSSNKGSFINPILVPNELIGNGKFEFTAGVCLISISGLTGGG